VRNRNLEVAKRGYQADRVASITITEWVEVSPFACPMRYSSAQEAVTGITAARQMRDDFCVALDAARRPLASSGAPKDGAERLEQLKVQPMRIRAN
jgi:hypothetical protein